MSSDLGRRIVEDFLQSSKQCIETIVGKLRMFKVGKGNEVHLYRMRGNRIREMELNAENFFLRTSVEYSNPQLTVEEVQGIIAARLLEVCGNYFYHSDDEIQVDKNDVDEICEMLSKPPSGRIVSYLLNTDDVEPDRYSMNPLKGSIVKSGQSAFPSAYVKTEGLEVDQEFVQKYEGSLISREDVQLIKFQLKRCKNSYLNMVDAVKYEQLENLSIPFGIDLSLPSMRTPITVLEGETINDLLHLIIRKSHLDYDSIENVYNCMGRSMKKKTTLLTTPHSEKGYGSKRAARGRIYFKDSRLERVRITYRTTPLYPNAIDPDDVSIARAEDHFIVDGDRFVNYSFHHTPSSPQFILYSLGSPEDAVLWHGIGAFGAPELVKSYTSTRLAYAKNSIIGDLKEYGITPRIPIQFNLAPNHIWVHPNHRNIDASIGCVNNLRNLAKMGMRIENLPTHKYIRKS